MSAGTSCLECALTSRPACMIDLMSVCTPTWHAQEPSVERICSYDAADEDRNRASQAGPGHHGHLQEAVQVL